MIKWVIGGVALVVLAVGLWAFQPWRLWTSSHVDEALPMSQATDSGGESGPAGESDGPTTPGQPSAKEPGEQAPDLVEHGSGDFVDAEHGTTGTASIIELGDGRRFVRLDDLATSDGPDLVVALSNAPSGGEWGSYDDDRYVDLGDLKATHGNQNYEIPDDVDLDGLTTVVIWCDRFNVAFGTAAVA
ncbi:DM13 domain-containing protein [Nocardioides sp. GXZ039]|uniref:DM13 domain-containing protein n=1 Tax=Nocardioides sp. GXZ039 TaxID=3136018 RepID=UPI0030F43AF3